MMLIASIIWSTLQIGILNAAPGEVFMVSALMATFPCFWIIIP